MCCIVNIYRGNLQGIGHEGYYFKATKYNKVIGVFVSGSADVSISFKGQKKVVVHAFPLRETMNVNPNRKPLFLDHEIEMESVSGVIHQVKRANRAVEKESNVSIYLILKEKSHDN